MLALSPFGGGAPLRRVLAIGCHADDIEIGCGGTLLALTRSDRRRRGHLGRPRAQRASARRRRARAPRRFLAAARAARSDRARVPGRVPAVPWRRGEGRIRGAEARVDPDLVFTHTRDDLHQDHRLACELTWNTFRDHLILEYEIPKVDGDLGTPERLRPARRGRRASEKVDRLLDALRHASGTSTGSTRTCSSG